MFSSIADQPLVEWIDPRFQWVLGLFGGVALTALATLFGSYLTRRHQNRVWLKDKRYEALLGAMTILTTKLGLNTQSEFAKKKLQSATTDEERELWTAQVEKAAMQFELMRDEMHVTLANVALTTRGKTLEHLKDAVNDNSKFNDFVKEAQKAIGNGKRRWWLLWLG